MTAAATGTIEVFYSYAHADEELRNELDKHLSLLRRQGVIAGWHDRQISAGKQWAQDIDAHLNSAQILLLLISADFLASDYCYSVEMQVVVCARGAGNLLALHAWLSMRLGDLSRGAYETGSRSRSIAVMAASICLRERVNGAKKKSM